MLAEDSAASAVRGRVRLPPVTDRFSYNMNEALERQLGQERRADYRLEVETRITERGLLVRQDNAVTRIQLVAAATMRLFRGREPDPVLVERLLVEGGFDETASLYASRTTRKDMEDRLARDLADRIARRVLAAAPRLDASG